MVSYIFPIQLKSISSEHHSKLSLQLYQNQLMLSTSNAIYSYGNKYAPFVKSLKFLKNDLSKVKSFLLLGTGLGSALHILQDKYDCFPNSVLVDSDFQILNLSKEYMNLNSIGNVNWVHQDAYTFLKSTTSKFDLIGIDVFKDLIVPSSVVKEDFIRLCHQHLNRDGNCIFNFVFSNTDEANNMEEIIAFNFKQIKTISYKRNTFYICKN